MRSMSSSRPSARRASRFAASTRFAGVEPERIGLVASDRLDGVGAVVKRLDGTHVQSEDAPGDELGDFVGTAPVPVD